MHVIIVGNGSDPRASAAAAAFSSRDDVTLGRVGTAAAAAEVIDAHAGEACLAILLADTPDDAVIGDLPILTSRTLPTLVLAGTDSRELRAAAFRNGASEVVFPPHGALRLEAACMVLLKGHLRTEPRCSVPIPAIIRTHEGSELEATVVNLSRGGFRAEIRGVLQPGAITHVGLATPAPWRMPTLYARVLAARDPEFGKQDVRAQWVGLAADEGALLSEVVESLAPETTAVIAALQSLMEISARTLRDEKFVAGIRIPPLTTYERLGIAGTEEDPASALARVAVVRCRLAMVSVLFQTTEDPSIADAARRLPLDEWRREILEAQEIVRVALAARMTEEKPAPIREMRDLQARLNAASDQIERVFADVTGGEYEKKSAALLQEQNRLATFEKKIAPEPAAPVEAPRASPPSSRVLALRVTAMLAVALPLAVVAAMHLYSLHAEKLERPAEKVTLAAPLLREGKIGVRSVFDDTEHKLRYVVVDAGWYQADDQQHQQAVWHLMEVLKLPRGWTLGVRDLAGVYLTSCRWPDPATTPGNAIPAVSAPAPQPSPARSSSG